jgi:tetratricopeptide (TPR) repeat protein
VRKEEGRYYLHPVDRDYAFSRIPPGKPDDRESDKIPFTQFFLLHRGADYFEQVRKPREEWKTKDDLAPQLAEFDLRCAGEDYETAAGVLINIDFDYLMLWGQYKTVIDMHRRLQGKLSDPWLRSASSGNLGTAYRNIGEYQEAINCYEQALDIVRENNNKGGESTWLGSLGIAYSDIGQVEKAIEYYEKALAIATEIGDRRNEGAVLGNLGLAYRYLGKFEKSLKYYEKVLLIAREIGNRQVEGVGLGGLGNAYINLGQVEKSIEYYEKALVIAREIGNRINEGYWLGNLGNAYRDLGQVEKAIEYYEKALAIAKEIGDRHSEGNHTGNLGITYKNLGQVEKAIEYHEKALAISKEIGDKRGEGNHLGNLGIAYSDLGQVEKAIEYYEQALAIAKEIGDRRGEGNHTGNLGLAYSNLGRVEKAIEYYEQALAIEREIGDRYGESADLTTMGDALIYQNLPEKAAKEYDKAVSIAEETKNQQNQNEARCGQALARLICMDLKGARSSIESACSYEYPSNDHNVLALSGVIALRMGETKAAKDAFVSAITKADEMLGKSKNNYSAFYAKGLSLSGLALCDGEKSRIVEAISAYKAARKINSYKGVVRRALILFDELAKADSRQVLVEVRQALKGDF